MINIDLPDECKNYRNLTKEHRILNSDTTDSYCDKVNHRMKDSTKTSMDWHGKGWYRLPKNTIIPDKATGQICTHEGVGWINSKYPYPNKTGMSIDINICIEIPNKVCDYDLEGTISHCDKYYVYYLP